MKVAPSNESCPISPSDVSSKEDPDSLPPVSLIVVNHNGKSKLKGLLDDCVTSLLRTNYPDFEILFVDNASNDGSINYVEKRFDTPRMRIVRLLSNFGYTGATNYAVQLAGGKIIGVLNNDITIVDPNWLRTLVQFMLEEPSVGIVSPALLCDRKRIDSLGGEVNVLMMAWDACSSEDFVTNNGQPIFVLSPPGAAFLFRKELAEKFQNEIFDTDYFAYYEDVCLGLKINLMGQRVAVVPKSAILHKRGSSWGIFSPTKLFLQRRNSTWTGMTIFDTRQVLLLLPVWLLSTFYAGILHYRLTRDPRFLIVPLRVVHAVLASMRKAWIMRAKFHQKRTSTTSILNFSRTLILDNDRVTFFRRLALATVNLAIHLAGLSKFTITRIKRYPLVDPSYLEKHS